MKPFVFSYTKTETVEKPLVDADGVPIELGSILRHEDGKTRGVVNWIGFPDCKNVALGAPPLAAIGDMQVYQGRGVSRISNQYGKWRHIPREETTYWERFTSWKHRPYVHDEDSGRSNDEGLACDGIMALLPNDPVDWEYGDWPNEIETALGYLVAHLESLTAKEP
jgi:hypothetical protein